jgi:hypothetical protein
MREFRTARTPSPAGHFLRTPTQSITRRSAIAEDALRLVLGPAAVTLLMWATTIQDVSFLQIFCAWILACFPWGVYIFWRKQRHIGAPIFVFVSAMYWLYYAVALFYGDRQSPAANAAADLSSDSITAAMVLCVVGVFFLWLGTQIKIKSRQRAPRIDIVADDRKWNYLRLILLAGVLLGFREDATYIAGEGGRQLIIVLQTSVPLIAFLILFRHYLRGQASILDKVLLVLFFSLKLISGISGGWLGTLIFVVLGCFLIYIDEKRRPPYMAMAPLLLYMVFFQAGKASFRAESWYGGVEQQDALSRVGRWAELSAQAWSEALEDSTGRKRAQLLRNVVMRASLLTQTAYVLESTPGRIPFQYGGTYSYLLATWVPRAFWPEKPSASDANRFYQVAYGLTREKDLESVSISIGYMTEGFINFGWFGVCGVMFGMGVLFKWVQVRLLSRNSGVLWNAIGLMLLLNFILIESQLATYFGGVVQQILIVLIVFLPLLRQKRMPKKMISTFPARGIT